MATADAEVESLKASVERYFSVYGVIVTPVALTFQVAALASIDEPFDRLRQELIPRNYIPTIARDRGETLVHIQRRPKPRFARRELNTILLVVTVATMALAGAVNWAGYTVTNWLTLEAFGLGFLFFGLPLFGILGAHEMGHYVVAKRYKVQASLPFFLPSIPPLGTFGAFISMRDPIPNRRALLDIGVSGPLVGFAIAIPVTLLGLQLSAAVPIAPDLVEGGQAIQPSLLYDFFSMFFPLPQGFVLHPTAFAGWVGLFVTAINLLPAGQLDGGHVARALLGNKQHYVSWAAVFALFVLGTFYPTWLIFGFLILMLGVRHPPPLNDITALTPIRKLVGIGAIVILILTFIPQPFVQIAPASPDFAFESLGGIPLPSLTENITAGGAITVVFGVNNTAVARGIINLTLDPQNLDRFGWTLRFVNVTVEGGSNTSVTFLNATNARFTLLAGERAIVRLFVQAPPIIGAANVSFQVRGSIEGTNTAKTLPITLRVV